MTFFGHHVLREVMRSGVLAEHSGSDYEELAIHFQFRKSRYPVPVNPAPLGIEIKPSIGRARETSHRFR